MANDMQALYQLGKNGITGEFLAQIDEALSVKELIKITVLKNAFYETKEVMNILCESLKCEAVSAVGSKVVIYRQAAEEKNRKIVLQH